MRKKGYGTRYSATQKAYTKQEGDGGRVVSRLEKQTGAEAREIAALGRDAQRADKKLLRAVGKSAPTTEHGRHGGSNKYGKRRRKCFV